MEQEKNIYNEVEKTLNSFDHISKAEIPPFFYTRLQARMVHERAPQRFWLFMSRPAVSLVTLLLMLILNITVITQYLKKSDRPVSQATASIQSFAQEFSQSGSSVYNDKSNSQ